MRKISIVAIICLTLVCSSLLLARTPERHNPEENVNNEDQGGTNDQYEVGNMYYKGKYVPQNYKEALKRYMKAAKQGNTDAQLRIGYMYYHAQGVTKDYIEAYAWYNVAASNGSEEAAGPRSEILKFLTDTWLEAAKARTTEILGSVKRIIKAE